MAIPLPRSRRTLERHRVPESRESCATFRWPETDGSVVTAGIHDLSYAGISLVFAEDAPPFRVGALLRSVELRVNGTTFSGEILVMHVTPAPGAGTVCGGLFYPLRDEDVLALRRVVANLASLS